MGDVMLPTKSFTTLCTHTHILKAPNERFFIFFVNATRVHATVNENAGMFNQHAFP